MKLLYSYHSEHSATNKDRWIHFALFLGAILLLLAGAQQLYVHFTSWQTTDDASYWHLTVGVIYLVIAALMTFLGTRLHTTSQGDADRYVRVEQKNLVWDLTQVDGKQTVPLSTIQRVDRRSIRDLELTLATGEKMVLPIYLVASHDKQEELLKVLWEIVPKGS